MKPVLHGGSFPALPRIGETYVDRSLHARVRKIHLALPREAQLPRADQAEPDAVARIVPIQEIAAGNSLGPHARQQAIRVLRIGFAQALRDLERFGLPPRRRRHAGFQGNFPVDNRSNAIAIPARIENREAS
jgi:hypothetical protein